MSSMVLLAAWRAPNSGAPMYTASAPASIAAFPTSRSRAGANNDMRVVGFKVLNALGGVVLKVLWC